MKPSIVFEDGMSLSPGDIICDGLGNPFWLILSNTDLGTKPHRVRRLLLLGMFHGGTIHAMTIDASYTGFFVWER